MPLEVSFTLSDEDLDRFQEIASKSLTLVEDDESARVVEAAAVELLHTTDQQTLPGFIAKRMQKLHIVIEMINDEEWQLNDYERRHVLSALAYLCDPHDMIPDHVPGLGFLDDAIYAEIVLRTLENEISLYEEFCAFRKKEDSRRKARGDDTAVDRETWLRDKRAALHATMRRRRMSEGNRGWRMRLW